MPADAAGRPSRLAIVGLGLIGGSIAAAVRARHPDVHLIGLDVAAVVDRARHRGLIDDTAATLEDLPNPDVIVLATPVATTLDLLGRGALAATTALVTDVASTKREVIAAAARGGVRRFVGGHPMAGSERAGIEHADPDLFVDRPWLVVTDDAGGVDAGVVSRLAADLGARPSFIDAETHDRAAAYFSHAPQLLALALMRAAGAAWGDAVHAYAGRAFREMTRTAASPASMWRDILRTNEDNVSVALRDILSRVPAGAALADRGAIEAAFREANDWRALLDAVPEERQ
jgi:prephenate dehydrogenase